MITLMPDEVIIAQVEAKGTGTHGPWKVKGKGVLYITNYRIAFEDEKEGVILNLDYGGELSSFKAVENDKLLISWYKDGYAGKMEFDVKDTPSLEAEIGKAIDSARAMQVKTTVVGDTTNLEANSATVAKEMIDLLHNYTVDSYKKYNTLEDNLEHLKPYIHTKLGNLTNAS